MNRKPRTKITDEIREEIAEAYYSAKLSQRDIAECMNLSQSTVSRVLKEYKSGKRVYKSKGKNVGRVGDESKAKTHVDPDYEINNSKRIYKVPEPEPTKSNNIKIEPPKKFSSIIYEYEVSHKGSPIPMKVKSHNTLRELNKQANDSKFIYCSGDLCCPLMMYL